MNQCLVGRKAIVTGAGRGLGAATARALVAAGSSVALFDVDGQRARQVAEELGSTRREPKTKCLPYAVDVSSEIEVQDAVDDVAATLGGVDVLINCAGIDYTLALTELSVDQWDQVIGVNLRGPFLTTRAVFPIMCRQSGGHVVNVVSTAGVRAWPNATAYCASKWGLIGFTRAVGTEGRAHNIRATAIVPGGMSTDFFDRPDLPEKPDPANLNDPTNVAEVIAFVIAQPPTSVIQEVVVTPLTETSWP